MNNKVLVKLYVPEISQSYDLFIPVNEVIWKIKKLIIKSIGDLSGVDTVSSFDYILINKNSGITYKNNQIVYNTDIRNSSELILLSVKKM